ncbi:MAG: hypothetical protein GY757_06240 [bacterium]|nr:hypothetical protein [bacterium]
MKPFGAIDTPAEGGTISGSSYINNGWVLTPQPNAIPVDGSTISVWVDGVNLGHPTYDINRPDVAALFPGYANTNGAGGYFSLDTTAYTNGVHTIYWTAEDDAGNSEGIGSRYFSISNPGNTVPGTSVMRFKLTKEPGTLPIDDTNPITVIKGTRANTVPENYYPGDNGRLILETKETEALEIHLAAPGIPAAKSHFLYRQPTVQLPIGSTFDAERGIFYWQPGPGFLGEYTLEFVEKDKEGTIKRKQIIIKVIPKFN